MRSRFDWSWVVIGACVAVTVYVAVIPLVFLLWQSFRTPQTASVAAIWTLGNYVAAYGTADTFRLFLTSIRFAFGASLFAFVVGTALAWMNERTNTPFKTVFFALSLIPLVIPSILFTVAWILLASPQIGIVNQLLQGWFGLQQPPFDIYSMAGMIWVDGLHYSPMAFLLMSAAFRAMDPSLEESATMSGASVWQVLWRVTLKLTWPAIFATILILFVRSIESFEVPALLGLPVGIEVFTSSIYTAVHRYPSQVGLASVYGVALLVVTSVGVYAVSRLSSKGSKYATMTGKGFRPRQIDLGKWRWLTASAFIVYFSLIVVLPFLVLLWSSFQRFYTVLSRDALRNLTLDPYRFVFSYPDLASTVWNSLLLSFGAATVVMLVTSVICWIVVKTKLPGRWLLDNVASLPLVFPGIVLGLSIMIFYLNVDVGIYGTIWIMFIAYITRFMPYGLRYNTTSMVQIHKELEDPRRCAVHRGRPRFAGLCSAAETGSRRRLDLRDDRLHSRTVDVHPAVKSGHACGVDRDLGVVGERPIRGAVGARLAVHPLAVRARAPRAVGRRSIRDSRVDGRQTQQLQRSRVTEARRHGDKELFWLRVLRVSVVRVPGIVLNVEGLFTEYPNDRGDIVRAAQDVTFKVEEGRLFTLLGPSGCGKTTTLRSIAGLNGREPEDFGERPRGVFIREACVRGAESPRVRHGVPVLRDLAAHDGVRERRVSARSRRPEYSLTQVRENVMRVLTACSSTSWRIVRRPSFPAASSSVSRSRAPLSWSRRCCCSTSRCRTSTPSFASGCASN